MRRTLVACVAGWILAGWAMAQDKPGMPDMRNVGPIARLPKKAQQDKTELKTFFKQWHAVGKKGDVNAMADMIDYPVMMLTDDTKGNVKVEQWNRDQWIAVMKPFMDPAHMKDSKWTSKETCFLMSDDLASCEEDIAMQMGKMKGKYNAHSILIRKDGTWKIKEMMEAGWGDMPAPKT
jgi:SnoaL-like protein